MKFYHEHITSYDPLREDVFNHYLREHKYRIMWELRHLEDEIKAEGGMIIFRDNHDLETKNFSAELNSKIWAVVHAIDWAKW